LEKEITASTVVAAELDAAREEFHVKENDISQLQKQLEECQQQNQELGRSQSDMQVINSKIP